VQFCTATCVPVLLPFCTRCRSDHIIIWALEASMRMLSHRGFFERVAVCTSLHPLTPITRKVFVSFEATLVSGFGWLVAVIALKSIHGVGSTSCQKGDSLFDADEFH